MIANLIYYCGHATMYALWLSSVIALGIIFERFYILRTKRIWPQKPRNEIISLIASKNIEEAVKAANAQDKNVFKVYNFILTNPQDKLIHQKSKDLAAIFCNHLAKPNYVLSTLAGITPLLGLLGTVIGMVHIFSTLGTNNSINNLAYGISLALDTTVIGLFIAIPSYVLYRYFQMKVKNISLKLDEEILTILNLIES